MTAAQTPENRRNSVSMTAWPPQLHTVIQAIRKMASSQMGASGIPETASASRGSIPFSSTRAGTSGSISRSQTKAISSRTRSVFVTFFGIVYFIRRPPK